jgi:opacity protein-like surface antigen
MKRIGLAAIALVVITLSALTSPAKAQEPPKWQGLYGGFYRGWAAVDDSYDDFFGSDDLDVEGWLTGLVGGYNHRMGQWLIGIEVDGAIVDAGDEADMCIFPPCRLDWNNLGTFRGRLGWIFGEEDQFAVYVTGGYATSGWDFTTSLGTNHFVLDGWLIGGGFEAYLFNTNWISNKIEYNYIDFGGGSETFGFGTAAPESAAYGADSAHVLKTGLNIHF